MRPDRYFHDLHDLQVLSMLFHVFSKRLRRTSQCARFQNPIAGAQAP